MFIRFTEGPVIYDASSVYRISRLQTATATKLRVKKSMHYLGEQYIIELKIWRGERYNADGKKQLSEYLDYFGLDVGYMLSFNFNKKRKSACSRSRSGIRPCMRGRCKCKEGEPSDSPFNFTHNSTSIYGRITFATRSCFAYCDESQ